MKNAAGVTILYQIEPKCFYPPKILILFSLLIFVLWLLSTGNFFRTFGIVAVKTTGTENFWTVKERYRTWTVCQGSCFISSTGVWLGIMGRAHQDGDVDPGGLILNGTWRKFLIRNSYSMLP